MGFTVYYRSTQPVSSSTREQVNAATDRLCEGKTWLSCEPVWFFMTNQTGYLEGGSKPNFTPHPDDVAEAESEGLPDGTIRDVIEVLCELSKEFSIDWEFAHDHDPGPIGLIQDGKADAELWSMIAELGYLTKTLEQEIEDVWTPQLMAETPPHANDDEPDDDDGPRILKFRPRDELS